MGEGAWYKLNENIRYLFSDNVQKFTKHISSKNRLADAKLLYSNNIILWRAEYDLDANIFKGQLLFITYQLTYFQDPSSNAFEISSLRNFNAQIYEGR